MNLIWIMPAKGNMLLERPFLSIVRQEFSHVISPGDCIALVIRDIHGRVLIVEENEENFDHGRVSGTWSIPVETCEENDKTFLNAAYALLIEEISGNVSSFRLVSESYSYQEKSYRNKPGQYGLHSAVIVCDINTSTIALNPINEKEIGNYRWVKLFDLENMSGYCFDKEALDLILRYKKEGFLDPL